MWDRFLFLADIKGSSTLANPGRIYARIDEAIATLNQQESLLVPLTRQYGDEVVGILATSERTYRLARALRDAAHPETSVRWVMVRGEVPDLGASPGQMGGRIFKEANRLMGRIKKRKRVAAFAVGSRWDAALAALCHLVDERWQAMTENQRTAYGLAREGLTHAAMAERLGKSRQSVTDAIKRAGVEGLLDAERAIETLLAGVDAESDGVRG